jgi:hypothetical protein
VGLSFEKKYRSGPRQRGDNHKKKRKEKSSGQKNSNFLESFMT